MQTQRKLLYVGLVLAILALLGTAVYVSWLLSRRFDPALSDALSKVETLRSYQENVEATVFFPDRTLYVSGIYLIDDENKSYASYATTTLKFLGSNRLVTFSESNIAIGADVYTKVQSTSGVTLSVPADGAWHHFASSAIPSSYANIAIAGPVLDVLNVFGKGGAYVTQVASNGALASTFGTGLAHYTLQLSRAAESADNSDVRSLAQRIGEGGTLDLWIDKATHDLRYALLHESTYTSTTTFSHFDGAFAIVAPYATN